MGIPQIIYLCLLGVALLGQAYLHGKPKTGNYNFFDSAISLILGALLIWWGGFFK